MRSDVAVGPFFDGSTAQPQRTAVALAQELAHDGAPADLVVFQPAPTPGAGVWATGDLARLESALAKGLGAGPPVLLATSPATQASDDAGAIESASCLPGVSGLLLDRLVDGAAPESATGLYDATGAPKPSAAAVKQAIRAVARGAVVCPGRAARVTPTTADFAAQLTRSSAASVVLGCDRDCLYLVALERADGQPLGQRRRSGADDHAAEADAALRRLPARPPARQPGRPRCPNAPAEPVADRGLTGRKPRVTRLDFDPRRRSSAGRAHHS